MRLTGNVAWVLLLGLASRAAAERPEITYVSEGVRHWEACYLFGEGFQGPKLKVLAWDPKDDRPAREVVADFLHRAPAPPATPPDGSHPLTDRLRVVSPQAIACVYRDGWIKVLWAETAEGLSPPYVANRPRLFFAEFDRAAPGQVVRIVGRNLIANIFHPQTSVWLVPEAGGQPVEADVGWAEGDFQNHMNYELDYVLRARIADDTPPGRYRVYVYVGQHGPLGVAGPLELTVAAAEHPAVREVAASEFGADGSDEADDTDALLRAVAEAAEHTPARVRFKPGTYLVSRPILVPPGVSLVGPGWRQTTLRANPDRPFELKFPVDAPLPPGTKDYEPLFRQHRATPLVHVVSDSRIEGLRLRTKEGVTWAVLGVSRGGPVRNVTISNCRLEQPEAAWISSKTGWVSSGGCIAFLGTAEQCEVSHCELRGVGGMGVIGGPAVRCHTSHNHYKPTTSRYGTSGMGWLIGKDCIVEYNHCDQSNRGFTCGPWFGPIAHNLIYRNQVVDGGTMEGAGESVLFEGPEVGKDNWFGRPAAVGKDWLEVPQPSLQPGRLAGRFALVMSGRGLGGFRRIRDNTAKRITLAEPWTVAPDERSEVLVRQFFYENLILDHYGRDTLGGIEFYGGGLNNVVERFVGLRTRMGVELFARHNARDRERLASGPDYHNLVRGSRFDDGMGAYLWVHREADQLGDAPAVLLGQRIVGCQFNRATSVFCNDVLERSAGGGVHWLPKAAPVKAQSPPCCLYTVLSGCRFQPQPGLKPLDFEPGHRGTVFWHNALGGQDDAPPEQCIDGSAEGVVSFR